MDPNTESLFDGFPLFRMYKSGCKERFKGTKLTFAGVDSCKGVTSKDVVIDSTTNFLVYLYLANLTNPIKNFQSLYIITAAFCVGSAASSKTHAFLNYLMSCPKIFAIFFSYHLAPENLLSTYYDDS